MITKTVTGRVQCKRDTTENWNNARNFVPRRGEIIVYEDYEVVNGVNIPGIKIGNGNAYVPDLPFIGAYERDLLLTHIANTDIHVTLQEKAFWNNKVTVVDGDVAGEKLTLTRN